MAKRLVVSTILLTGVLWFLPLAYSQVRQPGAVYDFDFKSEKPSPAPRRGTSGIWMPAEGASVGIQANGAQMMPSDGRPDHELPFTPAGRAAFLANKPSVGVTTVTPALTNDPVKGGVTGTGCDPVGFPRLALWNFRTTRIIEDPEMYSKPWTALRMSLRLQSPTFDIREMECVPSETAAYNEEIARPAAGLPETGK
jgi:hypothetical protein